MKHKLIPATEKESSVTIRLTPHEIGVLMAKVKPSEFHVLAKGFIEAGNFFHPDKKKFGENLIDAIKQVTDISDGDTE